MTNKKISAAVAAACLIVAPTSVIALEKQIGEVTASLTIAAAAQGATFDDPRSGVSDEDGEFSYSGLLNLEWVADNGWVYGFRAEADNGTRASEELARDEIYLYFVSDIGRIEIGEQDGPADVMSFHAPVTALGQVRGDFSRYAGSRASLSATDTGDEPKIVYLSAPLRGLRFGASYAPKFESNADDPDPRRRTIQRDAVELGVQYQRPLANDWTLGAAAVFVNGNSDPITQRDDLSAWSVGFEARRDKLIVGAAYVDNGDSNELVPTDETEWNVGVAWRDESWGAAVSFAAQDSLTFDNRLFGVGGYYEFAKYFTVRADAVYIDEKRPTGVGGDGFVLLVELGVQF
jgi:hypothetical protein